MRQAFFLSTLIGCASLIGIACPPGGDDEEPGPAAPAARACLEACAQTSDCNTDFECQGQRCVYSGATAAPSCTDNRSCTPIVSGWTELVACDASTPCSYGLCVDVAGQGHCVIPPPCTAPQVEIEWSDIAGNTVQVCGKAGYACDHGSCFKLCETDSCAGQVDGSRCLDSGHCGCETDADCTAEGASVCNAGVCGCASDADCTAEGADVCTGGVCGCTDADSCTSPTVHGGTHWVCETP